MEVRALKTGFFGQLRNEGDVFDVPKGSKASWFVETEQPKGKAAKPDQSAKEVGDKD